MGAGIHELGAELHAERAVRHVDEDFGEALPPGIGEAVDDGFGAGAVFGFGELFLGGGRVVLGDGAWGAVVGPGDDFGDVALGGDGLAEDDGVDEGGAVD